MDREDEVRRAVSACDAALDAIRRAKPGKAGTGLEAIYGQAYQRLVLLGARSQLKQKYRG